MLNARIQVQLADGAVARLADRLSNSVASDTLRSEARLNNVSLAIGRFSARTEL